jgi:signal peptidase
LKKVWSVTSTVIVILTLLFALFLLGTRLLGYRCYAVISGSMAPKYAVGDLIYTKQVDPYTITDDECITFVMDNHLTVATHEVDYVDAENRLIYTKGAANDVADETPVHFNNVLGVPKFSIPLLGYVATFVQTSPGAYISIAIGIALLLFVFLPDLLAKKENDEETLDEKDADSTEEKTDEHGVLLEPSSETSGEANDNSKV